MKTLAWFSSKQILGFLAVLLSAVLVLTSGAAQAATSSFNSSESCLRRTTAKASITISGGRATANFTLPKECKNQVVSLVSYMAPNGTDHKPYEAQKLYKATTRTFNVAGPRHMSVAVPDCYFQIDLVKGEPIQSFAGGRTYSSEGRMITASGGGNKPCEQPAAPAQPAPPAPPAAVPAQTTVVNVNQDVDVSQPPAKPADEAKPQPQPAPAKALPETGPGEIAALSFGTTMTAGLFYAYRRRFDSILASVVSRF